MNTDKINKVKDAIEWANKRVALKDLSQGFTPLQWEYLEFAFQDFVHKSAVHNHAGMEGGKNGNQITAESFKELLLKDSIRIDFIEEYSTDKKCFALARVYHLQQPVKQGGFSESQVIQLLREYSRDCDAQLVGSSRLTIDVSGWIRKNIPSSQSLQPKEGGEEVLSLLREVSMRNRIAFPQSEQDQKWFDEGVEVSKSGDFINRLFSALSLGIDEDKIEDFKRKISE